MALEFVEVDASPIVRHLEEIERRGKNMREVMGVIAVLLVEEVDENFETSGHGSWEPFSKNTKRGRGDMNSAKLLLDTGVMAASITPEATQTEAIAYTNDPKAKYHVSKRPRKKIPLRDFFDIDEEAVVTEGVDLILNEITQ